MKRPEIKISIPDALKTQLVDDWEAITKNQTVRWLPLASRCIELTLLIYPHSSFPCRVCPTWIRSWTSGTSTFRTRIMIDAGEPPFCSPLASQITHLLLDT